VRAFLLAVAVLVGCGGGVPSPVVPSATSATVSSAAPAVIAATATPAPNLPASGLDVDPAVEHVRTFVLTWSAALGRHDVLALIPLYEEYVRLYGGESPVPKAEVIEAKRRALANASFHQEVIGPVEVVREVGEDFTARFVKRSGSKGKLSDVRARLRVRAKTGGQLVIVEESDEPSDELARARLTGTDGCLAAAAAAVHGVREVAEFETRASAEADASGGKLHVGGFGPQELREGKFGVGMGFQSDDRFGGRVWYEVDRKTGKIELTLEGTPVQVGEAAEARVKAACAGR
jgi:hypothetical protein